MSIVASFSMGARLELVVVGTTSFPQGMAPALTGGA